MTLSDAGIKFIEVFEGLKLQSYQDIGGVWTIGYGHTSGVGPNQSCTMAQAEEWLRTDTQNAANIINAIVRAPLTQNEFDALVSFVYNIGGGNFVKSTTYRMLNDNDHVAAADAMLMWDQVDGQVVEGLLNRRKAERQLFLNGQPDNARETVMG